MIDLQTLIRHLQRATSEMPERLLVQHEANAHVVAGQAAEYLGHELPEWPPLSSWTVEEKTRLGYVGQVSATDPGLRTGDMQQSVEGAADADGFTVGSKDKKALWFEMGRAATPLGGPQPPRPFLALALQRNLPHLGDTYGRILAQALTPPATRARIP